MTFMIIENYHNGDSNSYMMDIETLDDLYNLAHDRFGDALMFINWVDMTITVKLF